MEESQSTFILYRDSEEKLGYPVRLDGLDAGLLPLLRMQRAAGDPALPAGGPPELQLYEDQYHQYCNFQVVVDNNPQPKGKFFIQIDHIRTLALHLALFHLLDLVLHIKTLMCS